MAEIRRRRRAGPYLLALYAGLLSVSHLVRDPDPHVTLIGEDERSVAVGPVLGDAVVAGDPVRFVVRDRGPRDSSVVVMLHGSPGDNGAVRRVGGLIAERYRVVSPDLPGFGGSSRDVPDYSFRAHAVYVLQMLDSLGVDDAHFVGFSMGGGVVLSLYDLAPERVRSAAMLAAIGVQEMELMGEYYLNHAVHGLQLAFLWALREATPHMGLLDGGFMSVEYARNFYDSDQRPLRAVLERFEPPMLILHGDSDPLVPPAAAREHHRLVPQSELIMFDGDHFLVFMRPDEVAPPIIDWVGRVDRGEALRRSDADSHRMIEASRPLDRTDMPPAEGFALVVLMALIIASTLVLEDLACIGTGLMVARGTIGFVPGTLACVAGLYIGDVLLYLAGRFLGRRALGMIPLRWMISEGDVARSSTWFQRRGLAFVFVSRFSPGTRLPTYFAAGTLRTSFWKFSAFFLAAILVWTPILVGVSALFGAEMRAVFARWQGSMVWAVLLTLGLFLLVLKVVVPAGTRRGRRLLYSRWRRLTRFEFWPVWVFYVPVVAYVLWLALRHRSLSVFTAANPAIELGGFVGESKSATLAKLRAAHPDVVPPYVVISGEDGADRRMAQAMAFRSERQHKGPIVVKPDVGERGRGVGIARDAAALGQLVGAARGDTILQEYRGGLEFGVFYYRNPGTSTGTIFSVTDKRFPEVVGDGVHTLEDLILADPRAVQSARLFLREHGAELATIPDAGERVSLVEIGTHCRGALFLDGTHLVTDQLTRRLDVVSKGVEGFTFGRYDIRVPSVEAFQAGRDIQVIELNGVTSEATHIYDPQHSVWYAYRTLFEQWRILFAIGAAQRDRGIRPAGVLALVRAVFRRLDGEPATPA